MVRRRSCRGTRSGAPRRRICACRSRIVVRPTSGWRARIPRCRRESASSRAAARRRPAPCRAAARACRSRCGAPRGSPAAPARRPSSRAYFASSRICAPTRVIAVLLAAARVAPGRLQVTAGIRADPHIGPRRRDDQRLDPCQLGRRGNRAAVRPDVANACRRANAPDAGRPFIAHVMQARSIRARSFRHPGRV